MPHVEFSDDQARPGKRPVQKPHARIIHGDASRRMSDAFLVRWNYAGKTSLSNCIGVSVSNRKSCKTTGVRPNVPIKLIIPCTCKRFVHEGTINGFRQRESACDAVTIARYGFSYRWFINRDTSKHPTQVSIGGASRRMSDASLCPIGRGRARGNDCDLLIRIRYRKSG